MNAFELKYNYKLILNIILLVVYPVTVDQEPFNQGSLNGLFISSTNLMFHV